MEPGAVLIWLIGGATLFSIAITGSLRLAYVFLLGVPAAFFPQPFITYSVYLLICFLIGLNERVRRLEDKYYE